MNNLENAKKILASKEFTCVLCNNEKIYTSNLRGVAPLLEYIQNQVNLNGFSAADKVIGKAAAMLFIVAGIKEVYADVMSRSALNILKNNNIDVSYAILTDNIINRQKTGLCPMEQAVIEIDDPTEGFNQVKKKYKELNNIRDGIN